MTNKKTTKKALVMSVLALALCFSMLIGTTYAWFTDSVTSGSNVITAGNLDIDVQYTLDGETWNDLAGAKDLFQKGLWEPGHTEVVALKITNKGTLALKYAASMNIFSETVGKTKDGQDIVLSDILTVSTLTQQANDAFGVGDIALDLAFNGENSVDYENPTSFNAGNVLGNDVELLPGDAHYVIIKVDMAETVGNEANHDGEHVPTIEFGINVLATQYTYENDSFDNQYDKDADYVSTVDTANALSAALLNGGIIRVSPTLTEWVLTKNEVLPEGTTLVFENDIRIVTNGYTLELQGATITIEKTLTLDGTLTVGAGDSTINGNGTIVRAAGKTMLNCQTENSSLTVSGITLDGGSINVSATKTPIVMIRNGAVVNVVNNAIVQNSISAKDGSAAFNVGLGTLNLDGAVIRNNKLTAAKGGAVYIRDGAVVNVKNTEVYGNTGNCGGFIGEDNQQGGCTVNIYSGNIHDNTSLDAGHSGVIYLRKTSVVNIYEGNFSNNSGIYSQDTGNATLNIMGGTFDSTNTGYFGGNNADSIITLSGSAKILANDTGLVFANGNASGLTDDILYIAGALNEDANIQLNAASIEHILSRTDGYIAKGLNYTITENDVAKFSCEGYTFMLDATNNTIVVVK